MEDFESQLQTQSKMIRAIPHDKTWERIEAKLEAHRSRRKLFNAQLLNIAASITVLIVVGLSGYLYMQNQQSLDAKTYALSIEELNVDVVDSESIFEVENIRKSYADLRR